MLDDGRMIPISISLLNSAFAAPSFVGDKWRGRCDTMFNRGVACAGCRQGWEFIQQATKGVLFA